MVSGPITLCQIEGEKVEVVTDFPFLGSKITATGNCSHEVRRCLLVSRKAMINLYSVLKNRDITLLTKVHTVKAMVFPVVTYSWESWAVKKAEHQRIDAFELWCWGRLLRVPWTALRSNQSILREINPEYSLEMSGDCVISSVLSCHNKNLKWWTLKPSVHHSSQTVLQLSFI